MVPGPTPVSDPRPFLPKAEGVQIPRIPRCKTSPWSSSTSRFESLDAIRGISALLVTAGHLRAAMFQDLSELPHASWLCSLFYFLTGLGHQAVVVFFVLSGFFVGGSVLKEGEQFHWQRYAVARLSRLWTVLIPALLFTLGVDSLTFWLHPEALHGQYASLWASGPAVLSEWDVRAQNFLLNALFLQTILGPVYGTNGPLWSLANEFWYYVLFPCCVLCLGAGVGRNPGVRCAAGILLVVVLVALPFNLISYGAVWILGVALWKWGRGENRKPWSIGIPLILFLGALLLSKTAWGRGHPWSADWILGLSFCGVAKGLLRPAQDQWRILKIGGFLSDISYSLYLVHFPLVVLICSIFYGAHQRVPNAMNLAIFVGWLALILLIAGGMWWAFERNTRWVRSRLAIGLPMRAI